MSEEETKGTNPEAAKIPAEEVPAATPETAIVKLDSVKRIFVYDGREREDPDPKMTVDEVRAYFTVWFPELANAEALPPVARPSKTVPGQAEQVIEFRRKTGTKGG